MIITVNKLKDYSDFKVDKILFDFLLRIIERDPFLLPYIIALNEKIIDRNALIDMGANGLVFIDIKLAIEMLRTIYGVRRLIDFRPYLVNRFNGKSI